MELSTDYKTVITAFILCLFITYTALLLAEYLLAPKYEPNEPLVVSQRIPFLGHLLGLLIYGTQYFNITSAKAKSPIHTLNILSKKFYVVTGPDLLSAVSRSGKTLSFNASILKVALKIVEADDATGAILAENVDGKHGPQSYAIETQHGAHFALAIGPNLDKINQAMLEKMTEFLKKARSGFHQCPIHLYSWTYHLVTLCSTNALYGEDNPFRLDPLLEKAFHDFDEDMNGLMFGQAPALIAGKGHRGRRRIATAFKQYYSRFPIGRSSALIEGRYTMAKKYGMSLAGLAQTEIGTLIAILVNSIPTTFHTLLHVFSDAALLRDIRAEVGACIVSEAQTAALRLNLTKLRDACPLLRSVFREALRVYGRGTSARLVLEDTMLNGRYLLKKDAVVLLPTSVFHNDPSVWGSSEFNPRRFLKEEGGAKLSSSASYRPFGGGSTLCPGRHFAAAEVMALTAILVHQYEVKPVGGEWKLPAAKQTNLAINIFPPGTDVLVWMTPREGMEDTDWIFGELE